MAFRAEARDYDTLIRALYDRAEELNVSREWIDANAGWADGYAGKIFGKAQVRRLGVVSLGPALGALGLKMIIVHDPAALARLTLEKRNETRVRRRQSEAGSAARGA